MPKKETKEIIMNKIAVRSNIFDSDSKGPPTPSSSFAFFTRINVITATPTSSITVTQNPFPTSEITSGDVEICSGTNTEVSISLTGIAPFTFIYTDGTTPITIINNELNPYNISASENGTYEVTYLRGGGGCVGSSMTGTAIINTNTLPSSVIIR